MTRRGFIPVSWIAAGIGFIAGIYLFINGQPITGGIIVIASVLLLLYFGAQQ